MVERKPFAEAATERARRAAKRGKAVEVPPGLTAPQLVAHPAIRDALRGTFAWLAIVAAMDALERDPAVAGNAAALDFVRIVRELAHGGALADDAEGALTALDGLLPLGRFAEPFRVRAERERRPGPVRAWLRRYVAAHPEATAAEAWQALKRRPPKGCEVFGDAGRRAAHITIRGADDMGYRRFANVLTEERNAGK